MADDANVWHDVPTEYDQDWQAIFQASREGLNLSAPCPVCPETALHQWYHLARRDAREINGNRLVGHGGLWEWCGSCHSYAHYSATVPEWWSCDLKVNGFRLTPYPTAIVEAMEKQADTPRSGGLNSPDEGDKLP